MSFITFAEDLDHEWWKTAKFGDRVRFFSLETRDEVIGALYNFFATKTRVRVHLGDPLTGLDRLEEHGIEGYVDFTTGVRSLPVLVYNKSSRGGDLLDTEAIVRVTTAKYDGSAYATHSSYHLPEIRIGGRQSQDENHPFAWEWTVMVKTETGDWEEHACFTDKGKLKNYLARLINDGSTFLKIWEQVPT